jgi:hypothetical protein
VEADAQMLAEAEPLLEDLRLVVHGQVDLDHAGRGQVADDPFDDRRRADLQERLGHLVGHRTKALAPAAGHDHRRRGGAPIGKGVDRADLDQPPVLDHGQRPGAVGAELAHERLVVEPRAHDGGVGRKHGAHRGVELTAGEGKAANVAVGDGADNQPVVVGHHDEITTVAPQPFHRFGHGRVPVHDEGADLGEGADR